jgi:hypothetical protein
VRNVSEKLVEEMDSKVLLLTVMNALKTNQKMSLQYYRHIRHITLHNAAKGHVVMATGKA